MPRAVSRSSSSAPVASATARSSCAPSPGGSAACAARSCRPSETSRCWAPSCRSRSIRRRAWSPTATIRAREAVSSAYSWALSRETASCPAISLTASSRSVVNAPRRSRFSSSSTARSAPRLRIGTASSEQQATSAKYGSRANRSSPAASATTSGSRVRWTYRSTDIGSAVFAAGAADRDGAVFAAGCGQQPVLPVVAPQQQVHAGGAGHRAEHLGHAGVQPADAGLRAQRLRRGQDAEQVDRSRRHRGAALGDQRPAVAGGRVGLGRRAG